MSHAGGRGWKGLPAFVGSVALAGGVAVVGARLLPPKLDHHVLQDTAHEQVVLAGLPDHTADAIRDRLWQEVVELGLDAYLDRGDIEVKKGSSHVAIHIEYVRPVELPGYTYEWRLVVHEEGDVY